MTTDFKATQVQTNKIIVTGSFSGDGSNQLLIYNYAADDSGTPNQGQIDPAKFDTSSGIGSDVFLFVSGGVATRGMGGSYGVTVMGGDLHVSGNLTVGGTYPSGGGSSADVLWEWNGVDTSQFTVIPVTSSGQTGQISVSGIDLSTNKAFSTLDLSALWAGGGGAMAFKINDLTLPEQFRLRLGVNSVPSGIRIGIMFFNSSSWGSDLAGGGMTFGETFLRWVTARGASAAFPPFDLPGATPGWNDPGTNNSYNGFISEWDCTIRSGSGGYPPAMALYGRSHGSAGGGSSTGYTITADRGVLIGSGSFGSGPSSIFNNTALTGLAIIAQSTALGSYTGSFGKIQILSAL